jgi:hypothetical protein
MSDFLRRRLEAVRAALENPVVLAVDVPGLRLESTQNGSRGASMGAIKAASRTKKAHRIVGFAAGRRFASVVGAVQRGTPAQVWKALLTGQPTVFHVVRLIRHGAKELDDDNLDAAFKAIRDGVAKGLGIDDRSPIVRYVVDQVPREAFGVRLELYAAVSPGTPSVDVTPLSSTLPFVSALP